MALATAVAAAASLAFVALKPQREITCRSAAAYEAYLEGMEAQKKIYLPEARSAWSRALAIDSTCVMASIRLGMMARSQAHLSEAASHLAHARSRYDHLNGKERLFVHLLEADLRKDDKQRDQVIASMLAEHPDDAEILFLAGNVAFFRKKYEDALTCFRKLIEKAPERGEVYNMMGYALGELGRWNEAIEAFQKYAFLYPDQANPHDSLGELYLRTGRYEDALKEFGKAAGLKPDFAWAHFHSALAWCETGRHTKAVESIDQAIARSTDQRDRSTWQRHAVFFRMMGGDIEAALRLAEELKSKEPERPVSWFALGRVHVAAGRPDLARVDLARMMEATEKLLATQEGVNDSASIDNFQVNELKAEIAASERRWMEADSLFCRSLKGADTWFVVRRIQVCRLECLVNTGRNEEALALAGEVLGTNPNEPSFHFWRGRALEALGWNDKALEHYRSALKALGTADSGTRLPAMVTERIENLETLTTRVGN